MYHKITCYGSPHNHPDQCYLNRIEYFAKVDVKDNHCVVMIHHFQSAQFGLLAYVFIWKTPVNYGLKDQHEYG